MAFDKKLTKAWLDYFENNYAWDDYENHGGDPTKYAKACHVIETQVRASFGAKAAAKMVRWAQNAYERVYYGRGPSTSSLKRSLPPEVDPKVFGFLPRSTPEILAKQKAEDIKELKRLAKKLGYSLTPRLSEHGGH